ncbi:hypothetical protein [Burkholderia sp. Ac-20365]|uniref:hypothetical protein n=1 Tax=Burkholderia sp. Ac-20365 TaxID=2703897 RepID=UPI00197C88EA|nr:hypothetical protein [Burkholderia sp. Ac-20365]MBN3760865.1 hypothetical protein [Burkholderia sp. Ac-20365]
MNNETVAVQALRRLVFPKRPITQNAAAAMLTEPTLLDDRFADDVIGGDNTARYQRLEIEGVRFERDTDLSDLRSCIVDNESPHFFSVYARVRPDADGHGAAECVGDFGTHSLALSYAQELSRRYEWPIDDRVPERLQDPTATQNTGPADGRAFRVSAYSGKNHSVHVERRIRAHSMDEAAIRFASALGEVIYPGRTEHPRDGLQVRSYGWTGHGQRLWVYEQ